MIQQIKVTMRVEYRKLMMNKISQDDQEEQKLSSLKQGGIYHFRNNNGVFKVTFKIKYLLSINL